MSFPPFPPFPAYAMYTTGGRGRGGGRGGGGGGHMAGPRGDQFGGWQWGWGGAGGGAGGGAAWQVQHPFAGRACKLNTTATRPLIPGSQWGRGRPRRSRLGRGIQRLGRQSARRPRWRRLGRGGRPRRRSEATGRLQAQVSSVSSYLITFMKCTLRFSPLFSWFKVLATCLDRNAKSWFLLLFQYYLYVELI